MAQAHFEEVDGGVEPNRPFNLDLGLMTGLQEHGVLRTFIARKDGNAVGYYTWQVSVDVESAGLRIANQGAWFVSPRHPRVAFYLFNFAKDVLKKEGIQLLFPHHRTQGRGKGIGRFFMRQGAKDIQRTYSLWIGD